MPEKEESKSSEEHGKDELEGATGAGVVVKPKKKKKSKMSRKSAKSRKSDIPACNTLEKCSVNSANTEISQSEWLNDIGGPKKPSSHWESFLNFVSDHKYSITATVVLAGVLAYFSVKKTTTRCPFTGKKST